MIWTHGQSVFEVGLHTAVILWPGNPQGSGVALVGHNVMKGPASLASGVIPSPVSPPQSSSYLGYGRACSRSFHTPYIFWEG